MHATIHRYEGVNAGDATEVISKVNQTLVRQLRQLPGFAGYYLIEGDGVLSSLALFESSDQADESTELMSRWITDEKINAALPDAPKITSGYVVAHSNPMLALA